ncbi:hypothetical protein P775_21320 [Puniceibacterium antarcticum]|uniref:Uncharacterized protein n=1 Tax=Puniceibacterium antarcticum TaxID=1206336 RepID=A0A2G8R9E5_9RHOB|nr:hypothetical protein [Puniceibacterium antarcticum]PIL18113.1 hypothetical protein P775_21320 [Puniceibacterium antarcticum]
MTDSGEALRKLPKGRWIGGTSVYLVTEKGGCVDRENLFVTEREGITDSRIEHRLPEALPELGKDRFDNGMSMILIPAFSKAHAQFAIDGACHTGLFDPPRMGLVTGMQLDDLGKVTPKVFDGCNGSVHEEGAMLMHVSLPADRTAAL